jgi:tRNA threonylcarbamoyladenosine biosynthesis protein TsaB
VPMLDARRLEVFSKVYDFKGQELRDTEAQVIDVSSFSEYLTQGKVTFLGDGAEKCKTLIQHKNAVFVDDCFPSAKDMATLSYNKFLANQFEDVAYFEPYYLKDFVGVKAKPRV